MKGIIDYRNVSDLSDKEREYMDYIFTHRDMVQRVWRTVEPLISDKLTDKSVLFQIDSLVGKHDSSKFLSDEFEVYRKKFYPEDGEEEPSDVEWEEAWKHHYSSNPHHPEYHVFHGEDGVSEVYYMEEKYVVEMLCDWTAMSILKGNSPPSEWFNSHKSEMVIHSESLKIVKELLEYFDEVYYQIDKDRFLEFAKNAKTDIVSTYSKRYKISKEYLY